MVVAVVLPGAATMEPMMAKMGVDRHTRTALRPEVTPLWFRMSWTCWTPWKYALVFPPPGAHIRWRIW